MNEDFNDLIDEEPFELYSLLEQIQSELIKRSGIRVTLVRLNDNKNGLVAAFRPNVTKRQIDYAQGILDSLYTKYKDEIDSLIG